ncbi:uncharacterized protein LOC125446201 [Sphaerodactylus townsendi]|uniref:uncharacterized protein LOC125446201 n=1 Tax=Sphaerodactylus townsendi TaxID=933632 RepID=UPI0020262C1C|nr:uncharacterized protein LOC125446201 [Sphaerodactylus townsendi]
MLRRGETQNPDSGLRTRVNASPRDRVPSAAPTPLGRLLPGRPLRVPLFSPTGNPGWAGRLRSGGSRGLAPGSGGSGIIFYQRRRDRLPHPVTRALYKKAQTDLEKLGRTGHWGEGGRGRGPAEASRGRLPCRPAPGCRRRSRDRRAGAPEASAASHRRPKAPQKSPPRAPGGRTRRPLAVVKRPLREGRKEGEAEGRGGGLRGSARRFGPSTAAPLTGGGLDPRFPPALLSGSGIILRPERASAKGTHVQHRIKQLLLLLRIQLPALLNVTLNLRWSF